MNARIERPVPIIALLTALNFLNYVDRYLVVAVAPKFQEQLSLSNQETGFVASAFMIGYAVLSPIFGRLADRPAGGRPIRMWLIAIGVALWSVATVLSGLSVGFGSMVLARIGVGVGEASYATIAPTIVDDLAPEGSKNKYLAVFYLATPVGSALGFLLGGILQKHLGWRAAFFVAGGPGLLLAMLVPLIREPARQLSEAKARVEGAYSQLARAPLFIATVAGGCAYTFALGGFAAWAPKFLYQNHSMDLEKADFAVGVVAVLAGIIGTGLGGVFGDFGVGKTANEETRVRAYLRFSAVATLIAAPFAALALAAPTALLFIGASFFCETALFASTSPMNAVTLGSVPPHLRATAMAVSIFAIHAFGDFPSPPLIGEIADLASLRLGLVVVPVGIFLCAMIWFRGVRAPLVRASKPST